MKENIAQLLEIIDRYQKLNTVPAEGSDDAKALQKLANCRDEITKNTIIQYLINNAHFNRELFMQLKNAITLLSKYNKQILRCKNAKRQTILDMVFEQIANHPTQPKVYYYNLYGCSIIEYLIESDCICSPIALGDDIKKIISLKDQNISLENYRKLIYNIIFQEETLQYHQLSKKINVLLLMSSYANQKYEDANPHSEGTEKYKEYQNTEHPHDHIINAITNAMHKSSLQDHFIYNISLRKFSVRKNAFPIPENIMRDAIYLFDCIQNSLPDRRKKLYSIVEQRNSTVEQKSDIEKSFFIVLLEILQGACLFSTKDKKILPLLIHLINASFAHIKSLKLEEEEYDIYVGYQNLIEYAIREKQTPLFDALWKGVYSDRSINQIFLIAVKNNHNYAINKILSSEKVTNYTKISAGIIYAKKGDEKGVRFILNSGISLLPEPPRYSYINDNYDKFYDACVQNRLPLKMIREIENKGFWCSSSYTMLIKTVKYVSFFSIVLLYGAIMKVLIGYITDNEILEMLAMKILPQCSAILLNIYPDNEISKFVCNTASLINDKIEVTICTAISTVINYFNRNINDIYETLGV